MKTKPKSRYRRMIAWYTALKEPDPTCLTPHGCAIVAAIRSFGRPCSRDELVKALVKHFKRDNPDPEKWRSDQEPTRIISFHKKTLLAAKFIKVTKKPAPLGAPAKAKPKAAPPVAPPQQAKVA